MPKSHKKLKNESNSSSSSSSKSQYRSSSVQGTPTYLINPDDLDPGDIYPYILKVKEEFEEIENSGRHFNDEEIESFNRYMEVVKKHLAYLDEEIRKLELNNGDEDEINEIKSMATELRAEHKKNIARYSRFHQGRTEKQRQLIKTKREIQDLTDE